MPGLGLPRLLGAEAAPTRRRLLLESQLLCAAPGSRPSIRQGAVRRSHLPHLGNEGRAGRASDKCVQIGQGERAVPGACLGRPLGGGAAPRDACTHSRCCPSDDAERV